MSDATVIMDGTTAFIRSDQLGMRMLSHATQIEYFPNRIVITVTSDRTEKTERLEVTDRKQMQMLREWDQLQVRTHYASRDVTPIPKGRRPRNAGPRIPHGKQVCPECEGIEELQPLCNMCDGEGLVAIPDIESGC